MALSLRTVTLLALLPPPPSPPIAEGSRKVSVRPPRCPPPRSRHCRRRRRCSRRQCRRYYFPKVDDIIAPAGDDTDGGAVARPAPPLPPIARLDERAHRRGVATIAAAAADALRFEQSARRSLAPIVCKIAEIGHRDRAAVTSTGATVSADGEPTAAPSPPAAAAAANALREDGALFRWI